MDSRPDTDVVQPDTPSSNETSRVTPLGDPNEHYWLALEMANTVGLDLQAKLDDGVITHANWADAITRCRGCDWAGDCPAWMAISRMGATPPDAPETCANAGMFNDLLARKHDTAPS